MQDRPQDAKELLNALQDETYLMTDGGYVPDRPVWGSAPYSVKDDLRIEDEDIADQAEVYTETLQELEEHEDTLEFEYGEVMAETLPDGMFIAHKPCFTGDNHYKQDVVQWIEFVGDAVVEADSPEELRDNLYNHTPEDHSFQEDALSYWDETFPDWEDDLYTVLHEDEPYLATHIVERQELQDNVVEQAEILKETIEKYKRGKKAFESVMRYAKLGGTNIEEDL